MSSPRMSNPYYTPRTGDGVRENSGRGGVAHNGRPSPWCKAGVISISSDTPRKRRSAVTLAANKDMSANGNRLAVRTRDRFEAEYNSHHSLRQMVAVRRRRARTGSRGYFLPGEAAAERTRVQRRGRRKRGDGIGVWDPGGPLRNGACGRAAAFETLRNGA